MKDAFLIDLLGDFEKDPRAISALGKRKLFIEVIIGLNNTNELTPERLTPLLVVYFQEVMKFYELKTFNFTEIGGSIFRLNIPIQRKKLLGFIESFLEEYLLGIQEISDTREVVEVVFDAFKEKTLISLTEARLDRIKNEVGVVKKLEVMEYTNLEELEKIKSFLLKEKRALEKIIHIMKNM